MRCRGASVHLGLGPVVHIRHEGLVLVGPDLGADVVVLVGGLGVVESHVVGVQELHHLGSETSTALRLLHGHSAHAAAVGTPAPFYSAQTAYLGSENLISGTRGA